MSDDTKYVRILSNIVYFSHSQAASLKESWKVTKEQPVDESEEMTSSSTVTQSEIIGSGDSSNSMVLEDTESVTSSTEAALGNESGKEVVLDTPHVS